MKLSRAQQGLTASLKFNSVDVWAAEALLARVTRTLHQHGLPKVKAAATIQVTCHASIESFDNMEGDREVSAIEAALEDLRRQQITCDFDWEEPT